MSLAALNCAYLRMSNQCMYYSVAKSSYENLADCSYQMMAKLEIATEDGEAYLFRSP